MKNQLIMALRLPKPTTIISHQEIADYYINHPEERPLLFGEGELPSICVLCLSWIPNPFNPAPLADANKYASCLRCAINFATPAREQGITRDGTKYIKDGKEIEVEAPITMFDDAEGLFV